MAGSDRSGASNIAALAALAASSLALGGVLAVAISLSQQQQQQQQQRTPEPEKHSQVEDWLDEGDRDRSTKRGGRDTRRSSVAKANSVQVTDDDIYACGFSMEEAKHMADEAQAVSQTLSPAQVLANLQRGNARFWTGVARRPDQTAFQRRALISRQWPTVAILGCSDSRVPIEIVFDQGLGDIFVIRVAGNCLRLPNAPAPVDDTFLEDSATLASLQYAVHHLKVKVVVVMGHEGCGAVKAAQLPMDAIAKEPEFLQNLLTGLRSGLNLDRLSKIRDARAYDRESVVTNVKRQVEFLVQDGSIMEKVMSNELLIVGAFYEISSGIVDFFHEVSEEDREMEASPTVRRRERLPSRGVLTRLDIRTLHTVDDEDGS